MAKSLSLLFRSLNELRYRDRRWNQVRLHFIGTSYASANRAEQTVTPIAAEYGVADLVEEQTTRVPYFTSLRLLQDADALLVVGSDSVAYNPSKLATYLFARKPLLAILHHDSPGIQLLQHSSGANLITFLPEDPDRSLSDVAQALQQTFLMAEAGLAPQVDQQEMANYSAREMTRRLCEVFDRALERPQCE
jgi:thiamine pyrophosphate-dependent acetolactate synthase large subunit-like protein